MIGELRNDRVLVDEKGIDELYKSGYFGRPKGNKLELSLVEAAYLLYRNKIKIQENEKGLDFTDFFKKASLRQQYFELKYIVYKDIRERGLYIQPGVTDFRVYPRGGHPGKSQPRSYIHVHSERIPLPLKDLQKLLETADNVHKQLILAIVDEESDITFYEAKKVNIKGDMEKLYPDLTTSASLMEDRVLIWDGESSNTIHENGFYGKLLDPEHLQLSLVESEYLLENNIIQVNDRKNENHLNFNEFSKRASFIESEFPRKCRVYSDLRNRGLVPKTGFKFGTHFRVYKQVESADNIPHSEYLVHALPNNYEFILPVMSRAIRLANSVKKRMLFAVEEEKGFEYIDIGRVKM
ncbi:tRNA-intron lyase [Methanohalobium sp.]|uniref:tRNA-intron lyase n=1 Tax=Methanohalobium sp. TaxID=2837493 RepID=UPI002600F894|nr:tRNA-intron lyase [Methanohalobium sp.]